MDGHEKILIVLLLLAALYLFMGPSQGSGLKIPELPFSFGFLSGKKSKGGGDDPAASKKTPQRKTAIEKPLTTAPVAAPPRLPPGNARISPLPAHLLTDPVIAAT